MKMNEALEFFASLVKDTNRKSENKIYNRFIAVLSDLKNRDLTEQQLNSIEEELGTMELKKNLGEGGKYIKQRLDRFIKYLKDELSLISKGYYTGLGTGLGLAFGAAFGSVFGMGLGIVFGMLIGLIVGASMDDRAEKQNRVLNTSV